MGGGGKGGSQTTTTKMELDPRLERGAAAAIAGGLSAASLPFRPANAVSIAAFTPQQQAAFQGADAASSAFGLGSANANATPTPVMSGSGIMGYNTFGDYQRIRAASMPQEEQAKQQGILDYFASEGQAIKNMNYRMDGVSSAGGGGGK
jgi:hypothetical protein